jgi:protein-tyrosine phosphatase
MFAQHVLCAASLLLFASTAPAQTETGEAERHLPLDGQSNFRDLGGYQTTDGREVKWGELFRSGELPRLSDADVDRLDALGVRAVVNFLTPAEIDQRGEDRLPDGVREIEAPIAGAGDDLALLVLEARKTGDFSGIPPELNADIHRILMTEASEEYATLLRLATDPANRPLVFHCSHGVHRTGTAAAILLSVLGVPWETVREDYLLSNHYRADEIDRRLAELTALAAERQGVPPDAVDTTNMEAFYRLQGAYIDASLQEAIKQYGSMDAYIRDGLGITDDEIEALRDQLLVAPRD